MGVSSRTVNATLLDQSKGNETRGKKQATPGSARKQRVWSCRAGRKPGSHVSDPPGCPPTAVKTEAGPGHGSRRFGRDWSSGGCRWIDCIPGSSALLQWMWFSSGASSRLFASSLVAPGVLPCISPVAPISFSLSLTSFSLSVRCSLIAAQDRVYTCGLWIRDLGSFPRSPPASQWLVFSASGMERIAVRVLWVYYED